MNSTAFASKRDYIATIMMLTVFKLLGLAPFTVRRCTGSKLGKNFHLGKNAPTVKFFTTRFGSYYNFGLIVLIVCILVLSVMPTLRQNNYSVSSTLDAIIDMAACVIGYTTMFVIWLIIGFKQRATVRLLNRLLSFDGTTLGLDESHLPDSNRGFFVLVCAINFGVATAILCSVYLIYGFLVSTFTILIIPATISAWFLAQYTFAVRSIEKRFRTINRLLIDCQASSLVTSSHCTFVVRKFVGNNNAWNIATLRRAHSNLSQIAIDVSELYSVPALFVVAFFCFSITVNTYYFVMSILELSVNYKFVNLFFWICQMLVAIVALATSVTNVTNESKKTCDVVKKLLAYSNNSHDVKIELGQFLLELLHRDVAFTACGLFSLDLSLVTSIISVVITYLIILLQF